MSHFKLQSLKELLLLLFGMLYSIGSYAQRATSYDVWGDDYGSSNRFGLGDYVFGVIAISLFFLLFIYKKEFRSLVVQCVFLILGPVVIGKVFGTEAGIATCLIVLFLIWKKNSSLTKHTSSTDQASSTNDHKTKDDIQDTTSPAIAKAPLDTAEKQAGILPPKIQNNSSKSSKAKRLQCPSCNNSFLSKNAAMKSSFMSPDFINVTCPACGDEWVINEKNKYSTTLEKRQKGNHKQVTLSCPDCHEKCKVPANMLIEITCPSCSVHWTQQT